MTQIVYLVKKQRGGELEIVGKALEPKSLSVLDFLDDLANQAGAGLDDRLSLHDDDNVRSMAGRLIPAATITEDALREALERVCAVRNALGECFRILAEKPTALFQKTPSGKKNWDIVRELLDLRTLLLQARAKGGFSIAICHD